MRLLTTLASVLIATAAHAEDPAFAAGRAAVRGMAGCFLVDYSYAETEPLKTGYSLDRRIYDVNKKKSVKEWIEVEELGSRRLRLQHVLFFADLAGKVDPESLLRHQAEDWEYDARFLYDFAGPSTWTVRTLEAGKGLWTRRVTNLDDGLRYQCAGPWDTAKPYPEWSCSSYAPIPGRETRDMGRKDYNALDRTTRLILYGQSWLERQENIKTIHREDRREPLAREVGKNWYVRIPDSECAAARQFAERRHGFWRMTREAWDDVLRGEGPFYERVPPGQGPRFMAMNEIEKRWLSNLTQESSAGLKKEIVETIERYRTR